MSIKYTPRESRGTLQPGSYVARVKSAQEAYSLKGDQMIEMEVSVGPNAEMKFIEKLYNTEKAAWKITQVRHALGFADEIGADVDFEATDLLNCAGIVEVGYGKEVTEGKHAGKKFLEILRWLPRGSIPMGPEATQVKDEIPMDAVPSAAMPF
jgi:hypothetical protein